MIVCSDICLAANRSESKFSRARERQRLSTVFRATSRKGSLLKAPSDVLGFTSRIAKVRGGGSSTRKTGQRCPLSSTSCRRKLAPPGELQLREILSRLSKGQFDSAERRSRIMISRFPEGLAAWRANALPPARVHSSHQILRVRHQTSPRVALWRHKRRVVLAQYKRAHPIPPGKWRAGYPGQTGPRGQTSAHRRCVLMVAGA